jgi:hypothetical protein
MGAGAVMLQIVPAILLFCQTASPFFLHLHFSFFLPLSPLTERPPMNTDAPVSAFSQILRWLRKATLISFFLIGLGIALYLTAAYSFSYSSGESVGFVQKLSKKGWVCKTWEGEQVRALSLQAGNPEKFVFTVRDDAMAQKINASIGQKVVLDYEQHKGLPGCFGDTQYFVKDVKAAP